MKPALKYALICILHEAGENGIWEYEMYNLLKNKYERSSICSMREDLISFSNIGWLSIMAVREEEGNLLRKYRLQKRHEPFIQYQLKVKQLLNELGITTEDVLKYVS